jgi:hypothetical protein
MVTVVIRGGDPSGAPSPLGGAARFVADLEAWVAAAAADQGVQARRRERWLRTQAEEEATILGVLADLAERDQAVVVTTRADRRHRGAVALVGRDFALVLTEQRSTVLVQVAAIVQVRTTPGGAGVVGDRALRLEVGWADALRVLAADRPRILAIPSGGAPCGGELRSVGADVLTMRLEGDGSRAYLPIAAVDEIVIGDATVPETLI